MHRLNLVLLLVLGVSFSGIESATAGPNAGGTLVISASEGIIYSSDTDYCGESEATGCAEVDTQVEVPDGTVVTHVMAAFPGTSRLQGVTFGIQYDPKLSVADWGSCADFELPEPAWPLPNSGVSLTFASAQTSPFVELYWFAISPYVQDAVFQLIPHPTEGAFFVDDSLPGELDPVAHLGSLGFGTTPGSAVCPAPGACCLPGDCQIMTVGECADAGGVYQGDGSTCDPDPCPVPEGACCFIAGECQVLPAVECADAGGVYQGDGSTCDPNPCPVPDGACCFVVGECQILTQPECTAAEGTYQGDGTSCDPDPCPQPQCEVDPPAIDFGSVPAGDSADTTFTITNTGGALLEGSIADSCAYFDILDDLNYALLPDSSRVFTVRFSPVEEGDVQCDLNLGSDCGLLPLSGTGGPPACSVETPDPDQPLILDFGEVGTGRTRDLSFTITNHGEGILAGTVTSECGAFSVLPPADYELEPGATATITVRFSPDMEEPYECTIVTGAGCDDVTALGVGVAPPICDVDPIDLNFGSVPINQSEELTFTITNTGVGDLEGTVTANCPFFSIIDGAQYSLGSGDSQDVVVRFRPTATGAAACSLQVGPGCAQVFAHGLGTEGGTCIIVPDSLDFGVVTVDDVRELTFEVRHESGGSVSGTVTESCSFYDIVGSGNYNLPPGGVQEFRLSFHPTSTGTADCILQSNCGDLVVTGIGDDAPACDFDPDALSFGDVPLGSFVEQPLTLTNVGGQVLSGTLSADCAGFAVVGDAKYSLARGEEQTFTIRFQPEALGGALCDLISGNPFCSGPRAVGRGVPGPSCAVSADTLDFGELVPGATAELGFSISNEGGGILTGSVQRECDEFSVLGDVEYLLGPGASKDFTVQFHPTSPGPAFCKLATGTSCDSIALAGRALLPPLCIVEPSVLDFGSVERDSSATRAFVVRNAGEGRLQGVISESCPDFTVERSGGGDPVYDLAAGDSAAFEVRFQPSTEGDAECAIAVGDSCSTVMAMGTGVLGPVCTVEPDTLQFGLVPEGGFAESVLVVRNDGSGLLTGTVVSDCPEIEITNGDYQLGAGQEAQVLVRFTPSEIGPIECTITAGASCDPVIAIGEGDAAPQCELSAEEIDLGTTTQSDSLVVVLTVTNRGGSVLTGTVSSGCPEFVVRDGAYELGRDESADITIVFHPGDFVGSVQCVLDTGEDCPDVLLRALVEPDPECSVSSDSLDFGEVPVGGSADRRFTLRNVGGGLLEGTVRASCDGFEVVGDSLYALGDGASAEFTIRFRPEAIGPFECLIETGGSCAGVVVVGIARSPDGACCFPDFSCHVGSSADCEVAGGTYLGDGTTCEPSPCEAGGACCVGGDCSIETQSDCLAAGGEWTEGAECDAVVCEPIGACCHLDGACTLVSQGECDASGGIYQGDGAACNVVVCEVLGACCFSDGECLLLTEAACSDEGGRIWSASTLCQDADCAPVGACCFSDGTCLILTEAECDDGDYQGNGVPCATDTCAPPGACCAEDGSCTIVEEAACEGEFLGSDEPCTPGRCELKVTEVTIISADTAAELRVRTSGSAVQDLQGWYRVGGTRDYRQIASFARDGDLWTGEFDRDDYTVRGIEYYLNYFDSGLDRLVPYGSPDTPYRVVVEGDAIAPALTPYQYRMVSAPIEIDPASSFGLLHDRFGDPSPATWRMGWWDPTAEAYVTVDAARPRAFESGSAYWLAFAAPQESWALSGRSRLPVGGDSRFARVLVPGWNMVGNPAAYDVSLAADQLAIDDGTVTRFDEARDAGLVSDIFVYDPSRPPSDPFYPYIVRPSRLSTWGGCWVENRTDHEITLLIPAVEAALVDRALTRAGTGSHHSRSHSEGGSGDPLEEVDWVLPIRALAPATSTHRAERATVLLAIDPDGRDAEDRFDLQLPPPAPGSRIRLALESAERSLLLDVRSDRSEPVWILTVESEVPFELAWDDPSRAGAPDWTLQLRQESGSVWDLRSLRSLPMSAGRHRIEIRGSNGLPAPEIEEGTLAVEPNPFRENTVFRFALPEPARMALSVFDASGQRVWGAPEQEMAAGEHAIIWTGRDQNGLRVPAGAYFVRLRAGDLERTERFVLLR